MFGEQRRMEWNFLKPSSFLNTIAAYSINGLTSLFLGHCIHVHNFTPK